MAPHPWALPTAIIFNLSGIALGLYTFFSPLSAARMFGLDLAHPAGGESLSDNVSLRMVPVFGGRNIAIGVAFFVLYWQRMPKAMGTLLLSLMVSGTVDTAVTGIWGPADKAWTHALGSAVLGLCGWGLLM
ncbi:hypothetical protein MMC18_004680 [Xylographa bjoerkii]|nr:hypothetical protein [Xylographa bjoerkii]